MKAFTTIILCIISSHFISQVHIDRSISEALKHPEEVKYLELQSADSINYLTEFSHLESLTLINFTDSVAPTQVGELSSLKELRLINDNFKYLPNNYTNLKQLERIEFIHDSNLDLNRVFSITNELPNLTEMRLEGFSADLESLHFPSGLKLLSLRDNHLKTIPKSVFSLPQLQVLDLGNNDITTLNNLDKLTSINTLYLDHQSSLENIYSESYFQKFKNLNKVYLPKDDPLLEKQCMLKNPTRFTEKTNDNSLAPNYVPNLNLNYLDYQQGSNNANNGKLILNINTKNHD
jgi:hypothetical protein